MSSYHIDQSGRVVMQVADTNGCYGCLYARKASTESTHIRCREDVMPTENYYVENHATHFLCLDNETIYVLAETT